MAKSPNRSAQRDRTRQAIIDGAKKLMHEGKSVTVASAAAVNGVSKATSYRYFSDPSVLIAETALDVFMKPYEEVVSGADGLQEKLRLICLYFFDQALANESGFRQFLAAAMTAWASNNAATTRGGRRIKMFRRALSEHETELTNEQTETLVRALSAATGIEAMLALTDVADATPKQAREAVAFMVDAIVDRMFRVSS
jgi:AcrR family transcriptional regulator